MPHTDSKGSDWTALLIWAFVGCTNQKTHCHKVQFIDFVEIFCLIRSGYPDSLILLIFFYNLHPLGQIYFFMSKHLCDRRQVPVHPRLCDPLQSALIPQIFCKYIEIENYFENPAALWQSYILLVECQWVSSQVLGWPISYWPAWCREIF